MAACINHFRKQLRVDWKDVIPGVALVIQVAFDNFFNGAFPKAASTSANTDIGSGPQCTGHLELVLRTVAFGITMAVGVGFMKWKADVFHMVFNAVFVFCWLFAISDFPLTCWINSDGALTAGQLMLVSMIKLLLTAMIAIGGVLISLHRCAMRNEVTTRHFCSARLEQRGLNSPDSQGQDDFRTVWQKVIPEVAIVFQFSLDSIFNWAFPKSTSTPTANTGSGPQCTGDLEFIWRTIAFGITAVVGLVFMKWKFQNTQYWLFHYLLNVYFVFSWLFAISDFPLTCWINKDGALTTDQLIKVSFTKFCIATIFVNVGVLASYTLQYSKIGGEQNMSEEESVLEAKSQEHSSPDDT